METKLSKHELDELINLIKEARKWNNPYLEPFKLYVDNINNTCQMSDLYMCSCGAPCSLNSRDLHLKTKQHLEHQKTKYKNNKKMA